MAKEVTAGQGSFEFLVQMVNLDKSGPMAAVTALWFLSTSKELGDVQSEAITLFPENSLLSFFWQNPVLPSHLPRIDSF